MDYGNQFLSSGEQNVWNASSLKNWEACPRLYYYNAIEGWTSGHQSVHLTFGSHYAWALMRYWQLRHEGKDRAEARLEVVGNLLEATWERTHHYAEGYCLDCGEPEGYPAECSGRPWTPVEDGPKDRFTLIRTFVWYLDEFREDLPLFQTADGPAVERQFRVAVDGDNFFVGTLDRVVIYGDTPWVMDQKTTKTTLSPSYFRKYHLDTQMSMYTWAGQAILSAPVQGVIIDAAQIAVTFSRFDRGITMRTHSQLEEWYDETMQHIEDARRAVREQRFPRNFSSCSMYGGCAFREVCEASPEVRKNILAKKFVRKET